MDVSGQVHLWDGVGSGDMKVVRRFQIPAVYKEECTCAHLSDNMLMAGAKHAVTIYDPRRPVSILSVPLARLGYCHAFTVRVLVTVTPVMIEDMLLFLLRAKIYTVWCCSVQIA